jgi:hypothetical protein
MSVIPLEYLGVPYPGDQQYSLNFFEDYPGKSFRRYDLEPVICSKQNIQRDDESIKKEGEESFITDFENKIVLWKSIFLNEENRKADPFGGKMKNYYRLGVRLLCPYEIETGRWSSSSQPLEKQTLAVAYSPNHPDPLYGMYVPITSMAEDERGIRRVYRIVDCEVMERQGIIDWIRSIRKFSPHLN